MGGCSSKEKPNNTAQMERPSSEKRKSITYMKPRDNNVNVSMQRTVSSETTKTLKIGGLNIRYGYMSQRGYYPDGKSRGTLQTVGYGNNGIEC